MLANYIVCIWLRAQFPSPLCFIEKVENNSVLGQYRRISYVEEFYQISVMFTKMWRQSECRHNLHYTQIISDGDSKTFSLLTGSSGPVTKLECVGHVQKRLGTGLRKLKKKLGGRGWLTDNLINAMQTYYGKAIRSNKGNIKAMQKATWAILYHQSATDNKTKT